MGKTSSMVKNRHNAKVYDRILVVVPKGRKAKLQAHAAGRGESLNGFIKRATDEAIEREGVTEKPDTWAQVDKIVASMDEKPNFGDFPRQSSTRESNT